MAEPGDSARVAVVTGAGQGLGRAIARRLAEDGLQVVLADLNLEGATAAAAELRSADREQAVAARVDVADEESVVALVELVRQRFGRLDVLVNNAALFSTLAMSGFEEIAVADWDRVMAVNVRGPFLCARAASAMMREAGAGKIVNIASGAVLLGRPGYLHYVTSKAGLVGMTRSLATELGPAGIQVNAVAPGSVETEVPRATVTADQVRAIVGRQAIGRRQRPEDVVGVVSFLASADSDFMTGQLLVVDGGAVYH